MIPVTKPFLPPRKEYEELLDGVWSRNWLTNNGPLVNEYELRLKNKLDVDHLLYLSNGTIALQIAIKALNLKGEIITTPFSYVATTSSIVWENCTPVFVDINQGTFNLDPAKISDAITKKTSAILATHCFGNPCDIEAIGKIAMDNNLKVIYDAAHSFGVKYKGESIFRYGDISTLSLHATKLVHSVEGGAVITENPELLRKMAFMRNFGHDGPAKFNGVGINGKNSEFHAAMGLAVLAKFESILQSRKQQYKYYNHVLENLNITNQEIITSSEEYNYSYYPILFDSEKQLVKSVKLLNKNEIFPRRYFYPVLSNLEYVEEALVPAAVDISKRVLCLPLYHGLSYMEQDFIARILLRAQNY
jgi:dTDP-4-amino-4,6-dideoxygalactose transaminase